MTIGPEVDGVAPVGIEEDGLAVDLLRRDGLPPWLRSQPAAIRLTKSGSGTLTRSAEKQAFQLDGEVVVETADGVILQRYAIRLSTEAAVDQKSSDALSILIEATPLVDGRASGPAVRASIVGTLFSGP